MEDWPETAVGRTLKWWTDKRAAAEEALQTAQVADLDRLLKQFGEYVRVTDEYISSLKKQLREARKKRAAAG